MYIALPRAPHLESPRDYKIATHVNANSRLASSLPHQPSFGSRRICLLTALAHSYQRWHRQRQDRKEMMNILNLAMKQNITCRQTPDIYQERLQTIMKLAGGQKDPESRWWELRSVMDDYERQDLEECCPNQLRRTNCTQLHQNTTRPLDV